jgi:hypothetical protein
MKKLRYLIKKYDDKVTEPPFQFIDLGELTIPDYARDHDSPQYLGDPDRRLSVLSQ